jgi:thioredoxin 2
MKSLAICGSCGATNRFDVAKSDQAVCGRCKAGLPVHDGVVDVDASSLQKLIAASDVPVVVDFWAPWCAPCRSFAPTFQNAAKKHSGKAIFAKLNTQADPAGGEAHQVRGIPTLISFRGGKEQARISGALPAASFDQWLQQSGV